ncbi:DMT family transporter [Roseateles saccharophilus]|uniref:EamA domain-containing membrane protein RarD n=1 Tax=Roseateles saccharophilus TaxID=304 RepID=A0A4R3VJ85_ROSSA|nr:DMT family transporter [Roseateles saccharophilus]MDG0832491.1 DMT family transporter [Roseateles saccharophilus]TCV03952.1 EamA domain-containing membrane protein RarD [Roseateles saccharophilus]
MTHRSAVSLMLLVTLMWSSAGVVTRHLDAARGFEITFWRSSFNALALLLILGAMRGRALLAAMRGTAVWASGLCWAVMFTAFMVALSLTTVANVLVTMSLSPLFTALLARIFLHQPIPTRTWWAIAVAGAGIAWMFGGQLGGPLLGVLVALGVPIAAATNWCLLQKVGQRGDMLPAVLIGALISMAATLPLAWPLQAGAHDLGLLAFLGVFQLALPCLLAVRLARELPGHELALLGQAETLLGVLWAWAFAGEHPGSSALIGGSLVLAALAANEALAPPSVKTALKNA